MQHVVFMVFCFLKFRLRAVLVLLFVCVLLLFLLAVCALFSSSFLEPRLFVVVHRVLANAVFFFFAFLFIFFLFLFECFSCSCFFLRVRLGCLLRFWRLCLRCASSS